MDRIQKLLCSAAIAALGTSFAPAASARSTIAYSGSANPLTNRGCFTESYGRVTNANCSGAQTWEIALPVEAPGTWNVSVDVTPTSDPSSVHCMAFGVSQDGTSFSTSVNIGAKKGGVSQTLNDLTVDVPGAGALYVGCFLAQGASVNTVNWNQPLQVTLYPQLQDEWCWAASGEMIMSYLGKNVAQCDEANHAQNRTDCCSNPSACDNPGWPDFSYFGFNYTQTSNGTALAFSQLQTEIAANRPVGFAWAWTGGGGHYMVAIGTEVDEGTQYVTINDPWAPNVGEQVTLLYSDWVSGNAGTDATANASYTHMADDYGISKK